MNSERMDIAAVNAALTGQIEALALSLAGEPSHRGRANLRFRAKGSLAVQIAGPKRGAWFDHESGDGGDPLGLIAHLQRVTMRDAYRWAQDWLGEAPKAERLSLPPPVAPKDRPQPAASTETARVVWREAMAAGAAASLVPRYLAARGLQFDPGAPLRFHPACPRGRAERLPAMLALMTDPVTGAPCGVHRTFLTADGRAKAPPGQNGEPARMMLGNAGVIRLIPDEDVTLGVGLAEGIETALSVMQTFGWRPVWAATSAGAIARFPVLPGAECLTIFADADKAGAAAADQCGNRWCEVGREVQIFTAPPQEDFNDRVRKQAR